jgi:integrase/recombinase XerC
MEPHRSQARMTQRLKIIQEQAGHSWASTTAVYTTVGTDARNRMLKVALSRAYQRDGDG